MQSSYHLPQKAILPPIIGTPGFVEALPADVQARLLATGQERAFAKGATIQSQGDHGEEFWFIQSGHVHIGRHSRDGKFHIFAALTEGQSFGEQAFLGEFPRLVDAIAASDAVLLRIGESQLAKLLTEDALMARLLLKAMAHIVQAAMDALEASRTQSTPLRATRALLAQCHSVKGEQDLRLTQQSLADLIGVSRVSLGKALRLLEEEGLVSCGYGIITVNDVARLREWQVLEAL